MSFQAQPSSSSAQCQKCERLEQEYASTIQEIESILSRKFGSIHDKIVALYRCQSRRDFILNTLYTHKRGHRSRRLGEQLASGVFLLASMAQGAGASILIT